MNFEKRAIDFDLKSTMLNELPMTKLYYEQEDNLWNDVLELNIYPSKNKNSMPFYTLSNDSATNLANSFQNIYDIMMIALKKLFDEDIEVIAHFFGKEFIHAHPHFVNYAKYTFLQKNPALYGRFDASINPENDSIKGIYEFNGDTPVMLFESVNLQNLYTHQVTGSGYAQFNDYYFMLSDFIKNMPKHKQFAVVCSMDHIEDIVTCETLSQIINDSHINGCIFDDIKNLNFDFSSLSRGSSPFYIGSAYSDESEHINVSDIFILSPWEELIENDSLQKHSAFKNWRNWCDKVSFYEPAWRWFISNKGFLAYITHLQDSDHEFNQISKHLPFLKTYMSPEFFIENKISYVSKPLIGRLSNNITIHYLKEGEKEEQFSSKGSYSGYQCVYQIFCSPEKLQKRENFIGCCWMAPELSNSGSTQSTSSQVASFCIREFDQPVLDIGNERFIPHLIID